MVQRCLLGVVGGFLSVSIGLFATDVVASNVVARVLPNGEAIELEIPTDIGPQKESLPLYYSGKVRYFSAGIGLVEREATYPPFSLKLVFTAGGKAFVTGVDVTLRSAEGTTVLTVPREQVTGPWLFIDLSDGTYEVAATLGDVTQKVKGIKVRQGHVTTQHVRWAEDRSPSLSAEVE